MKVTNLQEADFEKIEKFNQEVYPLRKGISEGFAHRFSENPYRKPDFNSSYFLEDDEQKIVGQFLLMPSEFFYREKSFPCNWGMDYILKEELRGNAFGAILAKKALKNSIHFGANLSEVSLKIHLAFKERIVGKAYKFIYFRNPFSLIKTFIKKPNALKIQKFPLKIENFLKIESPTDIKNNSGFWNADFLEFSRTTAFLQWRFFSQQKKYFFYLNNEFSNPVYFVLRPVIWRNMQCLILVDYRYDKNQKAQFDKILKSAKKITKSTKSDALIFLSSDEEEYPFLKKNWFLKNKETVNIVSNFGENFSKIYVTFADSDLEHFYGNNTW